MIDSAGLVPGAPAAEGADYSLNARILIRLRQDIAEVVLSWLGMPIRVHQHHAMCCGLQAMHDTTSNEHNNDAGDHGPAAGSGADKSKRWGVVLS